MNLETDSNNNTLRITLGLADLGQLVTERFVLLENCGQDGLVEDQSTIISFSRQRKVTGPDVYLSGTKLAVILPHLFLPVEIRGIRDSTENFIDTELIPRDFTTIVDVDRTEL